MAKNDYHVIVCQILAYLYQCLKSGQDVRSGMIGANSELFKVNDQELNKRYWAYIMYNLRRNGIF